MSDIIQVICGELTTSFDNEVMKAVQQVGINVNKEKLLKALELADKLVRCKDCKYWKWIDWADEYRCVLRNTAYNALADDYCSYGERIEE